MTAIGETRRVIMLGAASAVAAATARLYAAEGAALLLVARNAERLDILAADLALRGAASVKTAICDLGNLAAAQVYAVFDQCVAQLGGVDHIVLAYGVLGDQAEAEHDPAIAGEIIRTNFASAALWCLAAAAVLERQKKGALVVLGSVAGDRGRRSNYIYGATKSGLAVLVQGIAHRFGPNGPRAVIVKPGPIDTPMTQGMTKGGPLWASAESVAAIVRRAAERGGVVVYAPARWRWIMLIIRALPGAVFNRSKL